MNPVVNLADKRTRTRTRCEVLLFEPESTLNTGNVRGDGTVDHPEWV
jgi:hypothetical protein